MADEPIGALHGVKVLDAGRYVAGPWCAQLLLSLGAEVLRVERPSGGEDRWLFPVGSTDGDGAFFVHCNRGKQAMTLHATSPEGREIMGRLVDWADVIVANMPDDSLATMGLDWDTVHARNPRAVLATATTFGTTGPYAGRLGFDGIGQAMSGSVHMNGEPGRPMKSFVPWVDYTTASLLAFGVTSALVQRARTGLGTRVEGSLLGSALATTGHVLAEQSALHLDRHGTANRHPAAGPSDIVPTADGAVQLQVIGNPMFARWSKAVGRPDLVDDPRFGSDEDRGTYGEVLSAIAAEWCGARTTEQVLTELAAVGIPAGPLYTLQQALDDPHVRETMLDTATLPGLPAPLDVVKAPLRLTDGSVPLADRAPALGEHTESVLRSLGYGDDDLTRLRAARTI